MPLTEQVVVHDPVASGGRGWFHIKPGGKRMKWMIASDIHGSAYYCRKLLEAYEKEDIQIKSNENYREVKMILGEESDSAGFQGTFVKVISYMAVYQILNGCEPEEWDIHLIVEREEEIILDADIPDDKWVLTNEDFGE